MKFFITGTDTSIGKTYVTVALLKYLQKLNLKPLGLKPLASGAYINQDGILVNDDAIQLLEASKFNLDYHMINPLCFYKPTAPHIAAKLENKMISAECIMDNLKKSFSFEHTDVFLIEGCGGWLVPLNNQQLMSDVVIKLNLKVILVIGIKLGCLNHALLSVNSIPKNLLCGWIANHIADDFEDSCEIIQTLQSYIKKPLLGIIPFKGQFHAEMSFLDLLNDCRVTR